MSKEWKMTTQFAVSQMDTLILEALSQVDQLAVEADLEGQEIIELHVTLSVDKTGTEINVARRYAV